MEWNIREEEIVVTYYLNHVNDWRKNINVVLEELKREGFDKRDKSSTLYRLSNIAYLHTGVGQSKVSKQSREVYNRLKNKVSSK